VTTRTPVPLVEVPQSVQVLNRQLLEDQGLTNLADALTNVAGVVPAKPMEVAL
jgi:iron complex outermembrane receptor protein